MQLWIAGSKILHAIEVVCWADLLPFVNTGVTSAVFQSRGIFPLSTEIWNRWASPGASSSAAVFRSQEFSSSSLDVEIIFSDRWTTK